MKLTNKEASEWLMAIKRDYIFGGDEDYDERRKIALDMGAEALENQKIGHWVTWKEAGNEILSETRFECSVCHDAAQTLCNGLDLLSPYCPNCGAKMEGE